MPSRGPLPDTYDELVSGPSRTSPDVWERRRWWSRALGAAIAFVLGVLVLQLAAWASIPGAASLTGTPAMFFDPLALALGAVMLWLFRDRWPVRSGRRQLHAWVDRIVR